MSRRLCCVWHRKNRFKTILLLATLLFLMVLLVMPRRSSYAAQDTANAENDLLSSITTQMKNLDFSNVERVLSNIDEDFDIFGGSFKDKISQIVSGQYFDDYSSIFEVVLDLVFDGISAAIPMFMTIIAVAILFNIISSARGQKSEGVSNIVYFATYSIVILLMVTVLTKITVMTTVTVSSMKTQMDVIFPLLLTLLTAVGGVASVGVYKPIVSILSSGVATIFNTVLLPIFVISFIFLVIGNLSPNIKLGKFSAFLSSCFKWIVGFVFTLFSAFLAIQGISAGKFDGVSVKATKFAVKSYIPILGGYLSEGLDFILLSSVLIKNAIGVGGLLLILITVVAPVINIVVFKLGLQLTAAVIEPIGDGRISNFVSDCAKILVYPVVIILGIAFMYLISVGLIMCTANVV